MVHGDVVMRCGDIWKWKSGSWTEMTEVDMKVQQRISGQTEAKWPG